MPRPLLIANRLQRKVLLVILAIVVVPMLLAGAVAAAWVSSYFEGRLEQWIVEAARVDQTWLKAYQNDAVMLGGVLAKEPAFVATVQTDNSVQLTEPLREIAHELGLNLIQLYDSKRRLLYSSLPVRGTSLWEPDQTQAVLKVTFRGKPSLATVGITPLPNARKPQHYLVLGSLMNDEFINELSQLNGLKSRLYYRDRHGYFDIFTVPGQVLSLKSLGKNVMQRLEKDKQPYYNPSAEGGRFRGLYTPVVDSQGRVEAIMFSGLERRGFEELLTNRLVLFFAISLLGIAIGGIAGLLISRLVVRPVQHLRDAVYQLSGQNFNTAVPISSADELGDLAQAFNAMAVRLRQARDEQAQNFQKDKLMALGELSAALAHEIRNPIGVINTAAALLDKGTVSLEKQAELRRMLREESLRVANLVQDFLQFSRHRPPSLAAIAPNAPLERALATAMHGHDRVRVHTDWRHGTAQIYADAALLQQAWGNLIANALEAMGTDGGALYLTSDVRDGRVHLTIEDSGPGIDAQTMPRLFEPFFTTKTQGTGLGLSLAHTLVSANGGTLEALATQKRGARFAMHFPLHQEAVAV